MFWTLTLVSILLMYFIFTKNVVIKIFFIFPKAYMMNKILRAVFRCFRVNKFIIISFFVFIFFSLLINQVGIENYNHEEGKLPEFSYVEKTKIRRITYWRSRRSGCNNTCLRYCWSAWRGPYRICLGSGLLLFCHQGEAEVRI